MMTTQYQFFEVQQEMSMGDELDLQLRELIYAAQQHPAKSGERRKILNQLIAKIQNSGKLKRFSKYRDLPNFEDMYSEAAANTYLEICNKIADYSPEYSVMAWVNKRFASRFIDVLRKYKNQRDKILSLDELDDCQSNSDKPISKELSRVEKKILEVAKESKDNNISINDDEIQVSAVRDFVRNDPEEILQSHYIGEDKNANLQKVILMRFDEKSWEEISKQLGHPIPRLSELYQRGAKKRKILDYFRRYLQ
jgi:DNA-directed RNA polymerase specialized sigma24 family protein